MKPIKWTWKTARIRASNSEYNKTFHTCHGWMIEKRYDYYEADHEKSGISLTGFGTLARAKEACELVYALIPKKQR